jgi:hypothetical protein
LQSDATGTIKTIAGSTVLRDVSVSNAGTFDITTGSALNYQTPLSGQTELTNNGTINIQGNARLEFGEITTTLTGGGHVIMAAGAAIVGSDNNGSPAGLFNQDNTISGAGDIGEGQLGLTNNGTIDANATAPLVIATGIESVSNAGVLEASGKGGLVIESVVINEATGNGIWATNGSRVTVHGAVTAAGNPNGGNTTIDRGSTVEFGTASDENVRFTNVGANTGTLQLDFSTATNFQGTIAGFKGTSKSNTTLSDVIDFRNIADKTASLTWTQGSGQGVLHQATANPSIQSALEAV